VDPFHIVVRAIKEMLLVRRQMGAMLVSWWPSGKDASGICQKP